MVDFKLRGVTILDSKEILSEIKRTLKMEAAAIAALPDELNGEALVSAAEAIANCRGKVVVSACGTSAMAANKAVHSLNCIECPALFLTPSDAVHGGLGVLQQEDLLILISKGGSTAELLPLAAACKQKNAFLIAVSENPDSKLAKACDLYLKVRVEREPCRFNMLATSSTLAVIAVFDAICIALMGMTGYTREQFAIIHPGGAVGDRLLNKQEEK